MESAIFAYTKNKSNMYIETENHFEKVKVSKKILVVSERDLCVFLSMIPHPEGKPTNMLCHFIADLRDGTTIGSNIRRNIQGAEPTPDNFHEFVIASRFIWFDTPEGSEVWKKIHKMWVKFLNESKEEMGADEIRWGWSISIM